MTLAVVVLAAGGLVTRLMRTAVSAALCRRCGRRAPFPAARLADIGVCVLIATIVLSTLGLQAIVLGTSGVLALLGAAFVSSASGIANDVIAGFFLASDAGHLHDVRNRLVEGGWLAELYGDVPRPVPASADPWTLCWSPRLEH